MLNKLNNIWIILVCLILLYVIYKKISNLNQPFDEIKYINQYINQEKFKNKFNINQIPKFLPQVASMYVGIS